MVISASLQACGVVFPFAMLTSICRSIVTICSGLYLLIGMTRFSSKWILSHSTWYKFRRSRQASPHGLSRDASRKKHLIRRVRRVLRRPCPSREPASGTFWNSQVTARRRRTHQWCFSPSGTCRRDQPIAGAWRRLGFVFRQGVPASLLVLSHAVLTRNGVGFQLAAPPC